MLVRLGECLERYEVSLRSDSPRLSQIIKRGRMMGGVLAMYLVVNLKVNGIYG